MIQHLLLNIEETAAVILFGVGFTILLLHRNLIKKIMGMNIMDTATYLFLASKGYITGRAVPIVVDGVQEVEAYINPVPSGLVLTGIVVSVSTTARLGMIAVTTALSAGTLIFCLGTGESYTFMMGHFPAPWGNEIRAGILEGVTAVFFGVVMFLAVIGGLKHTAEDVEEKKLNLFYIMIDLMLSSLLALVYTNDLFTAYVFVEINTIAGCGLIMIRQKGRSMSAAIRYMIMSQLGSGLFLIGLSLLYDVTGHLLMSPAKESVNMLVGSYTLPYRYHEEQEHRWVGD